MIILNTSKLLQFFSQTNRAHIDRPGVYLNVLSCESNKHLLSRFSMTVQTKNVSVLLGKLLLPSVCL